MLHLDRNESPFDLEPEVKQALAQKLLEQSWNRYPPKFADRLTDILASKFSVAPDQVLLGNGSSEIIQNLLAIFRQNRTRLVYPTPSYELFEICGNMLSMDQVPWPCTSQMRSDTAHFPAQDGSIYIICNPNNPSGDLACSEFVETHIQAEPNSLFIIDEAYIEFSGHSLRPLVDRYPNAIVVRTLSKAMGLAGVRFGYALVHPDLAAELSAYKLPYRINHFSAVIAEYALTHEEAHSAPRIAQTNADREVLFQAIHSLFQSCEGYEVFPSHGNFLLLKVADNGFVQEMARRGVALGAVRHYPGMARVTVGTTEENSAFIEILSAYLAADN